MTENIPFPRNDLGGIVSNAFGERYLFAINRNLFQGTDASTVFRTHFTDTLFKENTFYIIAGTDSGLLYQYVKLHADTAKGSRYLFVELPQVLEHLINMDDSREALVVTTPEHWQEQAMKNMDMLDYAVQNRLVLIRSLGVIHAHYSEYLPFWRELNTGFDLILKSYQIGLNNRPFTFRQLENLTENQTPSLCLKDKFQGKTAVVLAGGPSLDDLIPWVQTHRNNLLVIAVSRVSSTLLKAGLQPDICVSVDPYSINLKVSLEMLKFEEGTLLINEFHLSSNLLSSWGGKSAFMGRRYPWASPLEPDNLPTSAGSTVTNTAISFAVETGVAQIVLGGADFCFSQTGHTHASGSAEHALGPRPMHGDKRVITNSGKMADTHNDFMNSATVVNLQAADARNKGCRIINPAAAAIQLSHVEFLAVENIRTEPMETPAREIISACLPSFNEHERVRFYKEVLGEIDRVLKELRTVITKAKQALEHNRKAFDKTESRFRNNAKLEAIEKQFDEKYASVTSFIKYFGIRRFVPLLRKNDQRAEDLMENSQLYFRAIIDTGKELTQLMGKTRNRVLSRIEEEKAQPDISRLIDQWRDDQQPGRAIQWARHHADLIRGLTEAQQVALNTFQQSFDATLEELNQSYQKDIETDTRLDGINARAREYFQYQDEEGLRRLEASLTVLHEQEDAPDLLFLVQGYLAELHNNQSAAITTYQRIHKGPVHIDGLMRLFELHTLAQDLMSALDVLKTLSEISPTYTPMYADLLQGTGEVEQAVNVYTDYLLANPDDLNSMMKLGKIYHEHGSVEGVEWAMNYILGKDPENQTARAMLNSLKPSQTTK